MTELQELFIRGMKPFFKVSDGAILKEVANYVRKGGVLLQSDKGKPVGFCIIHWPVSALDIPQVLHFYSEGGRALTQKLTGAVLDKVRRMGYNRLRATNGSGAPDDLWTRTFRHEGWEIKPVKTVFEFERV